jgi:hypothetical protein
VIRAGERADEIDAMRTAGIVGLRFEEVPDARDMTPQMIELAIAKVRPGAADLRSRLLRFVNDVHIGDLVVTPNAPHRELWVSIVTGPYGHHDDPVVSGYHHTRTADWLGWWDRGSSWLQRKLTYIDTPAVIVELRDPEWWFEQIGSGDQPRPEPDRARRHAYAAAAARADAPTRRASTPRAPATPRPRAVRAPVAPKPVAAKEPERALCAGQCGLQWRTNVLVDGLCPDCRGD